MFASSLETYDARQRPSTWKTSTLEDKRIGADRSLRSYQQRRQMNQIRAEQRQAANELLAREEEEFLRSRDHESPEKRRARIRTEMAARSRQKVHKSSRTLHSTPQKNNKPKSNQNDIEEHILTADERITLNQWRQREASLKTEEMRIQAALDERKKKESNNSQNSTPLVSTVSRPELFRIDFTAIASQNYCAPNHDLYSNEDINAAYRATATKRTSMLKSALSSSSAAWIPPPTSISTGRPLKKLQLFSNI